MKKKISDEDADELEKLLNIVDGNEKDSYDEEEPIGTDFSHDLVLFNDDFNHVSYVVSCVFDILNVTFEQADQIVTLIHFKGEASARKSNNLRLLKRYMKRFINSGISCEIRTIKK